MAAITVRDIPDSIYRALKTAAEQNHRSLNGEIVARLQASVVGPRMTPEEIRERARELRARVKGEITDEMIDAAKREGRP